MGYRISMGYRCGYRYGIWDIDMGYGISMWSLNISILSSWISIWDIGQVVPVVRFASTKIDIRGHRGRGLRRG